MSRSGYHNDCDNWSLIRWRGQVAASIRGKRGQKLLIELGEAMDAMPKKELIAHHLETNGEYCALGIVGKKRGIAVDKLDPEDYEIVACELDIASPLAREIVYLNDEYCNDETPAERWQYMRKWVSKQIRENK